MVVLDEVGLHTELTPGSQAEGLHEKSAFVPENLRFDQGQAFEAGFKTASHGYSERARPY